MVPVVTKIQKAMGEVTDTQSTQIVCKFRAEEHLQRQQPHLVVDQATFIQTDRDKQTDRP